MDVFDREKQFLSQNTILYLIGVDNILYKKVHEMSRQKIFERFRMQENNPLSNNIGKMLKFYRRRTGLTGDELAKRINVSQQQISRYENGINNITFDKLITLFNALEMNRYDIDIFFEKIKCLVDSAEYKNTK